MSDQREVTIEDAPAWLNAREAECWVYGYEACQAESRGTVVIDTLRNALRDLVNRCDGPEGVRADGSNIDTLAAHVALGDFEGGTDEGE